MATATDPEPLQAELNELRELRELELCRLDPAYFIDTYGVIDDAQGNAGEATGVTPFKLWDDQVELVWQIAVAKLVCILKARQLGISWLVCGYVLWRALYRGGQVILLLSKGQAEANELLRRIKALYKRLPPWMRARLPQPRPDADNKSEWGLYNGSVIRSLPATQNAGISFTASVVVMDEAAHQQWGSTLYANIKPTVDDGLDAQLIVLSTANGLGDFFHNLWTKAVEGVNGFRAFFLPYWSRPGRDQVWYEARVREAEDPSLIPQNYPANPVEAFVANSRTRFNPQSVAAQAANTLNPPWLTGRLHAGKAEGPGGPWPEVFLRRWGWHGLKPDDLPPTLYDVPGLSLFEPPDLTRKYLLMADVAEGLPHGDYCHGVVIDEALFKEVACLHGRWEPDVFADYLMALSEPYRARVIVERNNHGHAVLGRMKRCYFPRVVCGEDGRPGWYTTVKNKPENVSFISECLNKSLMIVRDKGAVTELQVYSRLKNGGLGAPDGYTDDRVSAWVAGLGVLRFEALRQQSAGTFEPKAIGGAPAAIAGLPRRLL